MAALCLWLRLSVRVVWNKYVTHIRYYKSQKQFIDDFLIFIHENVVQKWNKFHDKVSDNVRVISHEYLISSAKSSNRVV